MPINNLDLKIASSVTASLVVTALLADNSDVLTPPMIRTVY